MRHRDNGGMAFHVYIMSCASNTARYIGVTCDLRRRVEQHRSGAGGVHTARYRIRKLVYFETHTVLDQAIARERALKRWHRAWKNELIGSVNPGWTDLAMEASFP